VVVGVGRLMVVCQPIVSEAGLPEGLQLEP
jgi:hypothetical protein